MKELLKLAIKASIKAGIVIEDIYKNDDFELEIKNNNSPLTKADKASNNIINTLLKSTSIPIISEENKEVIYNERKHWKKCWIVDPLDGTKEFIKKNGEYTVNIALIENNKPILGVIFIPTSKELYYGNVGDKKAYKITLDKEFNSIKNWFDDAYRLLPKNTNKSIIKVVGSRSHMNDKTKQFIKKLHNNYASIDIVSKGSSIKFCLIAEGKADIYPRFAPTMEWDTAAGQAICEAVGIRVISKNTFKDLAYNKPNLLNNEFIVYNDTVIFKKEWMTI
ncbi:3'(2'),5'-bisphosphate nucleotidase CysQ [Sabulilitoribacter arenilitoris]|uniref:3'(2'),5'-bisphosphate nucleotidase CysQ n=1 Tax=Wocania arenilitoris TaxID=2044858 RepID=A0AAE3JKD7_9FLAO|nr:3'(2'),5'-bisphosphate nucleotidase CysQ [Wocania arenilitoris]MCF7567069.1 3'(2'),5'-bisphosphate nucleotidase CysQ [Wocania arenilitoris]